MHGALAKWPLSGIAQAAYQRREAQGACQLRIAAWLNGAKRNNRAAYKKRAMPTAIRSRSDRRRHGTLFVSGTVIALGTVQPRCNSQLACALRFAALVRRLRDATQWPFRQSTMHANLLSSTFSPPPGS
jgi:hypothetical protein